MNRELTGNRAVVVSRLRWWAARWKLVGALLATTFLLAICVAAPFIPFEEIPTGSAPPSERYLGPELGHPLGTDSLGRDMLVLLVKSTEAFALPGVLASLLALLVGVPLGALAGYMGGAFDRSVSFLLTLIGSFPRLVFILLACTIPDPTSEFAFLRFEPNMYYIGALAGFLSIPQVADAIRRRVLALKAEDFITASIAHGVGRARLLFYHIVWLQCFPEIVRQALYLFCYLIFLETGLAFLEGPGIRPGAPSWGNMLADAKDQIFRGDLWHALVPTTAIVVTTLGVTALGDVITGQQREERL